MISAVLAGTVLFLVVIAWYPPPLFSAAGGKTLLLILAGVDVVLGPALTFVVFRSGKRGLKFDLACIAIVQTCALVYGVHSVYVARPVFLVFAVDRFEVVSAAEIPPEEQAKAEVPEFRESPYWRYRTVAVEFPGDVAEQQRILFASVGGVDIQHFPQHYRPFDAQMKDKALLRAQTIEFLRRKNPKRLREIDQWLADSGLTASEAAFLPVRARDRDLVALLSRTGSDISVRLAPFAVW